MRNKIISGLHQTITLHHRAEPKFTSFFPFVKGVLTSTVVSIELPIVVKRCFVVEWHRRVRSCDRKVISGG